MYIVELDLLVADSVELLDVLEVVVGPGKLATEQEGDGRLDEEEHAEQ